MMKKRIVLFDANTECSNLPLGLLHATVLLDANQYDIRIITKRDYPQYKQTILELCAEALCFGVSCITGKHITNGLEMSALVKQAFPRLPIIWGGWQAVTLQEATLSHPHIDYICTGQGERTLAQLVEMLVSGDLSRSATIAGLGYKQDNVLHYNPNKFEDVNNFPDFNTSLISLGNHTVAMRGSARCSIQLHTSMGCPFRCGFCGEQNLCQRHWYGLSAERIIKWLTNLRAHVEFDSIIPTDSNFFVNEKRISELCRMLIEQKFNLSILLACGRTNTLVHYKSSTWELMTQAGLKSILIGMESANDETLRFINKDATVTQTEQLCNIVEPYGIQLHLSTVMGFPLPNYLQNPEAAFDKELDELFQFYKRLHFTISKRHDFAIHYYAPYPGSPLFELAIKEGFQPPRALLEWSKYEMRDICVPWIKPSPRSERKIRMLRYAFRLFGADYEAYIGRLPAVLRWWGLAAVRVAQWCADFRLRHNWFSWPIDLYFLTSLEKLFRFINAKKQMIAIAETFPHL